MSARIRPMTSLARLPSLTIRESASSTSRKSGWASRLASAERLTRM